MTRPASTINPPASAEKSNVRRGAGALFVLLAAAFVYWQFRGPTAASQIGQAYYTVDDGRTWFADDMARLPPFDKDGKQAVRAYVFRGADGKSFVGYLQRYTPEAKETIEKSRTPSPGRKISTDPGPLRKAYTAGREVKRPGDAAWVSGADPQKSTAVEASAVAGGRASPVEP